MTMAILYPHGVRSSLTWSIATFFTLFLVACACRPRCLFTEDGEFRALGVSDPRRTSVLAAPVGVFVIATLSVFLPLVAAIARGGGASGHVGLGNNASFPHAFSHLHFTPPRSMPHPNLDHFAFAHGY